MFKCKLNKDTPLSVEIIKKIIEKHRGSEIPRLENLNKYYHAKNPILAKQVADETLPNNKIAHPYASYITDTLTGYFMGQGVSYSSLEEAAADELQMVLEYNDEQDQNMELAKDASIFDLRQAVCARGISSINGFAPGGIGRRGFSLCF